MFIVIVSVSECAPETWSQLSKDGLPYIRDSRAWLRISPMLERLVYLLRRLSTRGNTQYGKYPAAVIRFFTTIRGSEYAVFLKD